MSAPDAKTVLTGLLRTASLDEVLCITAV